MNKFIAIFQGFVSKSLLVISILATTAEAAQQDVVSQIRAQEERWAQALVESDLETVEKLMHRDFRLIRSYSEAPPITKDMYLGMKGMSADSAVVKHVTLSENAGSVVVVRTAWSLDWQQEGVGKLPPNFDIVDTWIKANDGTWKILARVSLVVEK